ncbi:MAG: ABC transporter ATP-binding protein, partial [Desulfobacterales bacterium]|nr:ABC transporter ATP-binding protein [Desulfobacterales bacterium]
EIVMMGRYPHISRFSTHSRQDIEIVEEVMNKTGIYKFKDRLITELSGGEKQRVVFARALAQDTSVLIMDEGTSNLDINYALNLLNTATCDLKNKDKTIICVFQDINIAAMFCDELIFMKQGEILTKGFTDIVLTDENIRKVFNVDAKVYFESYSNSKQIVFKK